jgi:hypothetical protein
VDLLGFVVDNPNSTYTFSRESLIGPICPPKIVGTSLLPSIQSKIQIFIFILCLRVNIGFYNSLHAFLAIKTLDVLVFAHVLNLKIILLS